MEHPYCLNQLKPDQSATVKSLEMTGSMKRRLLDLGLIPRTKVFCLGRSPMGDPSAYLIRGAVIAIRASDSQKIILEDE